MTDARTKLDILYADVLGDIDAALARAAELRVDLRQIAADVPEKMGNQVDALLAATEKMRGVLSDMVVEVSRQADLAGKAAAEATKADIRQAAVTAAREAVGPEIRVMVSTVDQAATKLCAAAEKSTAEIREVARSDRWARVLMVAGGAILSAGLVVGAMLVLGLPGSALSDADAHDLARGKVFSRIWTGLSAKEQAHITELAKQSTE